MKKKTALLLTVIAGMSLSACGGVRSALTQTKAVPDEFSVYTRAPLTMPRDYGLRPPTNSEDEVASTGIDTQDTARRVLLSNSAQQGIPVQAATPGTTALLTRAGVQKSEPNIRQVINRESRVYAAEDKTFMDSVMFWKSNTPGTVVNAAEETKRIQENQALGRAVNDGETPMIKPKKKAPLEGMFDGLFK